MYSVAPRVGEPLSVETLHRNVLVTQSCPPNAHVLVGGLVAAGKGSGAGVRLEWAAGVTGGRGGMRVR